MYVRLYIYVGGWACVSDSSYAEVIGKLVEVTHFLTPWECWGLKSGCRGCMGSIFYLLSDLNDPASCNAASQTETEATLVFAATKPLWCVESRGTPNFLVCEVSMCVCGCYAMRMWVPAEARRMGLIGALPMSCPSCVLETKLGTAHGLKLLIWLQPRFSFCCCLTTVCIGLTFTVQHTLASNSRSSCLWEYCVNRVLSLHSTPSLLQSFHLLITFWDLFILCLRVSCLHMSVHLVCACCLWRFEDGVGFPGSGVVSRHVGAGGGMWVLSKSTGTLLSHLSSSTPPPLFKNYF